ncbi:2-oxo-4-hydroxy-4-carboxy-5-ureidoimidazoline decarboxylase [Kiloniella laminariae]|uniref:2-oxo-4-hydroxy-4-carboxy-5-ureidoimidazoline decarboxylase n=1 Tax=Kiloniella laminariae TaxID=454162 RepID=A0ABT4LIS7_9PROT|nr:2-oxo-4-hydroxy-4-carboxy-5-ureidoimidazoline decarboxylase [Kiloniella laminariae]MCZ4280261.1 2-oxo-4-hydroxy-4-carboxy-5-ureidoimidazoline decarboxylase [Kiloniella laminariae]
MSRCYSLKAVNLMDAPDFAGAFGDIAEHSPWVAELAGKERPFANRDAMIGAFAQVMFAAEPDAQLALIRAHPDLAGKAALAGELTEDSKKEQAGVGLDQLTAEEFERFTIANDRYREKFGFPFIFAVKGATKFMIMDAFEARLENDTAEEFRTALEQIARIIRFRLEDRVQ